MSPKKILALVISPAIAPMLFLLSIKLISGYELQGPSHSQKLISLVSMMFVLSYVMTLGAMLFAHLILKSVGRINGLNTFWLSVVLTAIFAYILSKTQTMSESWFFVAFCCCGVVINLIAYLTINWRSHVGGVVQKQD